MSFVSLEELGSSALLSDHAAVMCGTHEFSYRCLLPPLDMVQAAIDLCSSLSLNCNAWSLCLVPRLRLLMVRWEKKRTVNKY